MPLPAFAAAFGGSARRRRDGRGQGIAASYSRFSSSLQDESSIIQQQNACRESAKKDGLEIRRNLEFSDEAVSGTVRERDGLNAMLNAARRGEFEAVYFFSLSRLAREEAISLPILKDLVHNVGVRVVSVTEGVDSTQPGWELQAMFRTWMHREYITALGNSVRAGQDHAIEENFALGDYCFGYGTEPIPGSERGRKGRQAKPRMQYMIVEEEAECVRQIFNWFVRDRFTLKKIARLLNEQGAPTDHRSSTKSWRGPTVRTVLRNRKYIGRWQWGKKSNRRDPLTGKVRQEESDAEEIEKWDRNLPELRIVDEDIFAEAQRILDPNEEACARNRRSDGRLRGPCRNHDLPRHLLQNLLTCGHCGATMIRIGKRYMGCPHAHDGGTCPCRIRLRRDVTEEILLRTVRERLLDCPKIREQIFKRTVAQYRKLGSTAPAEQQKLKAQQSELKRAIENLVDSIEQGIDDPQLKTRMATRRRELRDVELKLAQFKRQEVATELPTAKWVEQQLESLRDVLDSGGVPAALALQKLLGKVRLELVPVEGKDRPIWRGTISLPAAPIVTDGAVTESPDSGDPRIEVTVDFVKLAGYQANAEKVMALIDEGLSNSEIARRLNCPRDWAWKARKYLQQKLGEEPKSRPMGRKPGRFPKKAELLSDSVKELQDKGLLNVEIAKRLGCNTSTVMLASRHWYESRGLDAPDGRTRRKSLERKTRGKRQSS